MTGKRLSRDEYFSEYDDHFWKPGVKKFWKLERTQVFVERGSKSYDAFAAGDWERALELFRERKESLRDYHDRVAAHGLSLQRVRVVEEPFAPYVIWELNSLLQRVELGEKIRVVRADRIAQLEANGPVPDVVGFDNDAAFHIQYTPEGLGAGAIRFTDQHEVLRLRELFEELFNSGEELPVFFENDIAGLRPPNGR